MKTAVDNCRDPRVTNRDIKFGICGEHGGDPKSVSESPMPPLACHRPQHVCTPERLCKSTRDLHTVKTQTTGQGSLMPLSLVVGPPRSSSCSRWAWTTPRAAPSACPSRASPPPRPPSWPRARHSTTTEAAPTGTGDSDQGEARDRASRRGANSERMMDELLFLNLPTPQPPDPHTFTRSAPSSFINNRWLACRSKPGRIIYAHTLNHYPTTGHGEAWHRPGG